MAKYYVQSGSVRTVLSADDFENAALWVVHLAMRQVVPFYSDAELSAEEKGDVALVQGTMVLGDTVQMSEVGFDRDDAFHLDTFDLLVQWHWLMVSLSRLEDLLD